MAAEPAIPESGPRRHAVRLTPLQVPKAKDVLADDLRERILRGDFPEDTALPPERELAEEFGLRGKLTTGSDFEPLLHLYAQQGEKAFDKLNGLLRYIDGDYADPATFAALKKELEGKERPAH